LHAPFEHPLAHVVSLEGYDPHAPLVHVPAPEYVRSVVEFTQYAAGGVLHVTPAHGSSMHAPFLHPRAHVVVAAGYAPHVPFVHDPGDEYVRNVVASTHVALGG
jgi:hypothetical protein